jgi:hypothetical protein
MDRLGRGIIAGFLATLALSGLFEPLVMFARTVWSPALVVGWQLHFFVAPVLWGAGFALFHDHVSGPSWLRGILFGVGISLVITGFWLAFSGRVGLAAGTGALAAMWLVHVAYGALLGVIYGLVRQPPSVRYPERHLNLVVR